MAEMALKLATETVQVGWSLADIDLRPLRTHCHLPKHQKTDAAGFKTGPTFASVDAQTHDWQEAFPSGMRRRARATTSYPTGSKHKSWTWSTRPVLQRKLTSRLVKCVWHGLLFDILFTTYLVQESQSSYVGSAATLKKRGGGHTETNFVSGN